MYVGDGIAICGVAFSVMGIVIAQIKNKNGNSLGKSNGIHCPDHSGVCADIENIKKSQDEIKIMFREGFKQFNDKLDGLVHNE